MNHIDDERRRLGQNLDEIEDRIKGATDLKGYFDRNTGIFLGSAVAAGILASLMLKKRRNSQRLAEEFPVQEQVQPERVVSRATPRTAPVRHLADKHMDRLTSTFDSIIDGLIGVACGKVVSFIADIVPNFQSEYDSQQQNRNWSSMRTVNSNVPPDATSSP